VKKEKSFRAAPQRRDVKKEEDIAPRRSVLARDYLFFRVPRFVNGLA